MPAGRYRLARGDAFSDARMGRVDAYAIGYYVGALVFFLVLAGVFWFAGRWGWIGIIIRAICVGLALLKALSMLAHPGP